MIHIKQACPAETKGVATARPQSNGAEPEGFISESKLRERLPYSRRTIYNLRIAGKLPYLCIPGTRKTWYHWPTVEAALLRLQRNGE